MPDITQIPDEELQALAGQPSIEDLSDEDLDGLAEEHGLPSQESFWEGSAGRKTVDDLIRSIASGATFGFADEIAAAASSVTGIGGQAEGKDYETLLAAERARDESIPLSTSLPGNIAGGVATGGILGKGVGAFVSEAAPSFAATISNLPGWIKASGLGAAYGWAYGAGGGEEGERLESAAEGAQAGAVLGAVGYPVVKAVTAGGGKVLESARKRWGAPAASARAKVAEAVTRDEMTGQRLQQRVKDLGPQGTIADAGGKNVQGIARHTASVPGPAQNRATILLNQRAEGEGARVASAISKGLDPQDYYAAQEGFLTNMRTKAGPLYQAAYEKFSTVTSPSLSRILHGETGKKALREAITLNKMDLDAGLPVKSLESAVKSGKISLEAWDDIKRGFDSLLDGKAYRNELTGNLNKKGWKADSLRRTLLKELDAATGGKASPYAQARAVYAGEAEALGALRDGRKALNWDPERITAAMEKLSESGKEAFRSGIARALKDVVAKTADKASSARRIFGTVLKRKQIRAAFPDARSFRELGKALIAEQRFAQTRNYAIGGSQTAPRAAESVDALTEAGKVGGIVAGSNIGVGHPLLMARIYRQIGAALMGKTKAHDLEAAKILFARDPAANRSTINTLFTRSVWDGLPESVKQKIGQAMLVGAGQQGAKASETARDLLED